MPRNPPNAPVVRIEAPAPMVATWVDGLRETDACLRELGEYVEHTGGECLALPLARRRVRFLADLWSREVERALKDVDPVDDTGGAGAPGEPGPKASPRLGARDRAEGGAGAADAGPALPPLPNQCQRAPCETVLTERAARLSRRRNRAVLCPEHEEENMQSCQIIAARVRETAG